MKAPAQRGKHTEFPTAIRRFSAFVIGGLLSFACLACARSGRPQTTDQARAQGSPAQNQTTTAATKKQTGVWHQFGEESSPAPEQPSTTGGWRHFGPATNAPKASPATAGTEDRSGTGAAPHASAATTQPAPAPSEHGTSKIRDMERQMFDLVNRDRSNSGGGRLQPLRWNEKLAAIARAHSLDMARRGYFGHVSPNGQSVADRLAAARIAWQAEGENIAINPSVGQAETAFMNEPRSQKNHRWNILNRNYTAVGIGIVVGPHGEYYITQDFLQSPPR